MEVPARIHVLLAKDSPQALVIRRGPSKQTAIIGWNRKDDSFRVGQWIKGKVYHYRSDISPNGRYWIYFTMSRKADTWTAVATVPYFKAIDFYEKNDAWYGGGLFVSDKVYWLNDDERIFKGQQVRKESSFIVENNTSNPYNLSSECAGIYSTRLLRDGWVKIGEHESGRAGFIRFSKKVNAHWSLVKIFHGTIDHPVGKGVYYEEHELVDFKTGRVFCFPDWEWADVESKRILWAEKGKIMAGRVTAKGLEGIKELYDTNPLKFMEIVAPY